MHIDEGVVVQLKCFALLDFIMTDALIVHRALQEDHSNLAVSKVPLSNLFNRR